MGTLRHFTALFCAFAASFCTFAAVVHVSRVFLTLSCAGLADMSAELAYVGRMGAAAGHERNGRVADFGAVAVKPDAGCHHFYILLAQACIGTVITFDCAGQASIDTALKRWVCHMHN